MESKILVGIRTTKIDHQTHTLYSYYSSQGIDITLVIDETASYVEAGFLKKTAITISKLESLGLFTGAENIGWLCGDYALYVMAHENPDYSGYWLIEDDALIYSGQLKNLLAKPLEKSIDFSAHAFGSATDRWPWKSSIQHLYKKNDVKKCLFGICYMSKEFCASAFNKRIELSKLYNSQKNMPSYPNDESFVMNALDHSKFKLLSLSGLYGEEFVKDYKWTTSGVIHRYDSVLSKASPGFFHPILITGNNFDYHLRASHIYRKQKKDFTVPLLTIEKTYKDNVEILHKANEKKLLVLIAGTNNRDAEELQEQLRRRWITSETMQSQIPSLNDLHSNYKEILKEIKGRLACIDSEYTAYWIINKEAKISLPETKSLAKELSQPMHQNKPMMILQSNNNQAINAIYVSRDYLLNIDSDFFPAAEIQHMSAAFDFSDNR